MDATSRTPVNHLLACLAALALATLTLPAIAADRDLDGVPDEKDNCRSLPNAPDAKGHQSLVCGALSKDARAEFVYLQSRTFPRRAGIDAALNGHGERRHVFLHVARDDGPIVLNAARRASLERADVWIGDYLPHDTFYASLPSDATSLARISALPSVHGLSAIQPEDRIARSIRASGGVGVTNYEVAFFADVSEGQIATALGGLGITSVHAEGTSRIVELRDYQDVLELAVLDSVEFIDEADAETIPRDEPAEQLVRANLVERVHGFNGAGLTVAMAENHALPLPPDQHPDLTQRVVKDSSDTPQFTGHNLEVAGIMIGDGILDSANSGFLPEAVLFNYGSAAFPSTSLHTYFDFVRQAREHGDAAVFNYSIGPRANCNRVGAYRKQGHHLDRAVHEIGMVVSFAAGNTRGERGVFAVEGDDPLTATVERPARNGPCRNDGVDNLPHPVPKNPLMVGNWDLVTGELASTSAVGPAEDGRLKPDIVAPGNGVATTTFNEDTGAFDYRTFSGTSAAAPAIAGVAGQVLEAFSQATVARIPTEVPPASVKAILLHTARDVGPFGPDHFHGYGMVDAAEAVRVALSHSFYVHESVVGEAATTNANGFDVDGTMYGLKVTLVWDDEPASRTATEALINDLDLTVIDPSGNVYYPLDTRLTSVSAADRLAEAQAGARECLGTACADHVNNAEQVFVLSDDGQPLETGTWTAEVSAYDIASGDQPFSVVVTPDNCPLRIYADTTLSGPVNCPDDPVSPLEPLAPAAVIIEYDDVTLDCADNIIMGAGPGEPEYDGTHTGIYSDRDRIAIRNCVVENFDTGIELVGSDTSVIVGSEVYMTDVAVSLDGDNVDGIENTVVTTTELSSASLIGIHAKGDVDGSVFTGNRMLQVGASDAAILIEASEGRIPGGNSVAFNSIGASQIGVSIQGWENSFGSASRPDANLIFGNFVDAESTIGIEEVLASNSEVFGNFLYPTHVGVQSIASLRDPDLRHIGTNLISGPDFGVVVLGNAEGAVSNNTIVDVDVGVMVLLKRNDMAFVSPRFVKVRSGNVIVVRDGGTGVHVLDSEHVAVTDNTISNGDFDSQFPTQLTGLGITVAASDEIEVTRNAATDFSVGLSVTDATAVEVFTNAITNVATGITVANSPDVPVMDNAVNGAQIAGIVIAADRAAVTDNIVDYVAPNMIQPPVPIAAIDYAEGTGGVIERNTLTTSSQSANAIRVGGLALFGNAGEVHDLEIGEHEAAGFDIGIKLRPSTRSVTIRGVDMNAAVTGLSAGGAIGFDSLELECSRFAGGTLDVDFAVPEEVSRNIWTEIADGSLDVTDSDGDGDGDAGTDHIFSSTDYTGAAVNTALTSTRTSQVADSSPWLGSVADCLAAP